MAFPSELAAVLSGATMPQLSYWRRKSAPLLVPEVESGARALYSFRDIIALRTVAKLRTATSLQAVRTAFKTLRDNDLTDHPSMYTLVAEGTSITLVEADTAMDLVKRPGVHMLFTLEDLFGPFKNKNGREVVNLRFPRTNLEVREHRLGGWPTAKDTRVPFDAISDLMETDEVTAEQVSLYYPTVTLSAAADAVDFADEVTAMRRPA